MAPLPPESTARFYLDYSDGTNNHTLVNRVGAGVNASDVAGTLNEILLALSPSLYLLTVLGLRVSSDGSNITNPVSWGGSATFGSGEMPVANAPRELRFQGRSPDGRKVSVSIYGYKGTTPDTYRILSGDNDDVDATVLEFQEASAGSQFLTISTQVPVWKTYASFNFNSYWEREARG